jgi:hypothetical protein
MVGLTSVFRWPGNNCLEHHNKAPRPSWHMQFGNNVVVPTESTDNTISFDDTTDTPIFFNQPVQDFSKDQSVATINEGGTALHQPLQDNDNAVLPSVSIGAGTSLGGRVCKMSRAMAESVSQQEFYSRARCTTWCHKLCVNMTMSTYMPVILTFKNACIILLHFLQK